MSSNNKITIIIPCYNCENSINQTLSSLQEQSFKDFKIICIDDGSSDKTLEIIKSFQEQSSIEINLVSQSNQGVSSARNAGIRLCETEYLAFCDADDIYHSRYLELLLESQNDNNTDCSFCKLTRRTNFKLKSSLTNFKKALVLNQKQAMDKLLLQMGEIGFYCYLYKTNIVKSNNILFDEKTSFGEDREFIWKYLCHCRFVSFVDEPLYWYRVVASSATLKKAKWNRTDLLSAVNRVEEYMIQTNCDYIQTFKPYMFARSMWSVAKSFSISKNKDLFKRLQKEYDVKSCMKITLKDKDFLVKLASLLYLFRPSLFYFFISLKKEVIYVSQE